MPPESWGFIIFFALFSTFLSAAVLLPFVEIYHG